MGEGVEFDPGFVKHMSAFVPNIKYAYEAISMTRDFNRRKQQFKMFFPKIQSLIKNYLGFYSGCILWAMYIKQFEREPVLNNLCFGGEYNERETLSEVDFMLQYFDQLAKDVKYYMGQNFSMDSQSRNIVEAYREFLKVNEGFVKTKTTADIKIPSSFKTPKDLEKIHEVIKKVTETGRLYELFEYAQQVL